MVHGATWEPPERDAEWDAVGEGGELAGWDQAGE